MNNVASDSESAGSISALEQSLSDYELQLTQVEDALQLCKNDEAKLDLYALQNDIMQVIKLTRENLTSLQTTQDHNDTNSSARDTLLDIPGSKCQAPFIQEIRSSNVVSYYNALVMCVESNNETEDDISFEDIKVRVMFVNPVCREMIPCPFYLEDKCKYAEENCHYSHGYVVNFSELKEFKEPDFHSVQENSMVLAKDEDNLWKRALVISMLPDENRCKVRFESGIKKEILLDLHDLLPLEESTTDTDVDSNNSIEYESDCEETRNDSIIVEKSSIDQTASKYLGEWEKHTKSIGSKLMANMGYIAGTGLGKNSDGRIEPVPAVVLPPGKSLDHCMKLREASGGDPDLFKAERLYKKLQERHLKLTKNEYTKIRKKDEFFFINTTLAFNSKRSETKMSFKETSERTLSVEKFKVGETIQKAERDVINLQNTLSKLPIGSVTYNNVQKKLQQAQHDLSTLQETENSIGNEQKLREMKKKMSEF